MAFSHFGAMVYVASEGRWFVAGPCHALGHYVRQMDPEMDPGKVDLATFDWIEKEMQYRIASQIERAIFKAGLTDRYASACPLDGREDGSYVPPVMMYTAY
jgi:hypothetical protein